MKFFALIAFATTLISAPVKADVSSSGVDLNGTTVLTIYAPILTAGTTLSLASVIDPALKEEMKEVEADAYNFLAGEELSLALEEQMAKVRELAPELADATDEELVAVMIQITNIK